MVVKRYNKLLREVRPDENKFHQGNDQDKKHYWLTPPEIYIPLDQEFNFDFDNSPYPLR